MLKKQKDSIQPWLTLFPIWNQSFAPCLVLTVVSCPLISQETGKVVWYSHLFKNFPVYCDPHSQHFSIANEAEVDFFLEPPFSMTQWTLAIWSPVSLSFLNLACTFDSSEFTYCWNLVWRILSITLLALECNYMVVWTFFDIVFLLDWNENWPFLVLWPLLFSKFAGVLSAAL